MPEPRRWACRLGTRGIAADQGEGVEAVVVVWFNSGFASSQVAQEPAEVAAVEPRAVFGSVPSSFR